MGTGFKKPVPISHFGNSTPSPFPILAASLKASWLRPHFLLKNNGRNENDCTGVYYLGDGYSDEIAMRFVHNNCGKAIFVHQPIQEDSTKEHINKIYQALNIDRIVDFKCIADYKDGSQLSNILLRK